VFGYGHVPLLHSVVVTDDEATWTWANYVLPAFVVETNGVKNTVEVPPDFGRPREPPCGCRREAHVYPVRNSYNGASKMWHLQAIEVDVRSSDAFKWTVTETWTTDGSVREGQPLVTFQSGGRPEGGRHVRREGRGDDGLRRVRPRLGQEASIMAAAAHTGAEAGATAAGGVAGARSTEGGAGATAASAGGLA
jgi:hypothetical protein